ncbi:elongation factor 1-gamma-like [Anguilla anguilla]|uniref:elongation factor 1-gamma-like n=1 Tax=Anguilla anguilla TaxID=7936 RepID=UPI0015B30AD9|nr:elongation factor 1-gamma-like [Anguilla anguilla]
MATLYTPRDFWRSYPILISAQYSGARITVDPSFPGFKGEDSRETDCFLSDFPLRKVPTFVENGFWIQEASAIANYVASDVLRGSGPQDQALVQQWVNLAEGEIVPSMATWVYPAMGRAAYSEKASEKAKEVLLGLLSVLNQHLLPRTYLVGDAVTLADISVACALLLLFTQAMEPSMRQVYLNVTRWFCTCVHQPQFHAVLGDVVLRETAAVPGKLDATPASSEILKAPQQEEVSVKQQQQQEEVPQQQQAEEQKQQQVEEQEDQKQPQVGEEQKQPQVGDEQKQPQVEEEQKQPQVKEEQKEQPQVKEEHKEQPQVVEDQKHLQEKPQVKGEQKEQPPVEEEQKQQPQVEEEQKQKQPQVEEEQKQKQPQVVEDQKQPQVEEGLDATEEALAAEPKAKDPFASLPKSSFVLDEFKRTYSNEDTLKVALPYLWEKLDPNGWSLWYCEYKYPSELSRVFMSCNLITGMFQRLDRLRKHAFASVALLGADGDSSISGVWLLRGQRLPFELCEDWKADYESYSWRKLDPGSEETRTLVREYLSWQGDFKHVGKTFNQAKIFK